ncbi:MAG: glycoside hydrolase family 97 protein [Pyrinomonadaceae bacterium]|nr:glycoside hydrolase family 97 protein [Pyrinomonadaceae bacterium]
MMNRRELIKFLASFPVIASLASEKAASELPPNNSVVVESPDKKIRIVFGLCERPGKKSVPCYSVFYQGKPLVHQASMGIDLAPAGPLDSNFKVVRVARAQRDQTYAINPGKTSTARDRYREAVISLEEQSEPRRRLDLIFRAYNDGAAFRYRFPQQPALRELVISSEHSTFSFVGDPKAYTLPVTSFKTPYEFHYKLLPLKSVSPDSLVGLPLLLEYPDKIWVAITEADLTDYAGMYLSGMAGHPGILTSRLAPRPDDPQITVKASLPHVSPWRVLMIADDPGRLIESNIVTNLNPPSAIRDTSWIKLGKTTFPWWNGYEIKNTGFTGGQNTQTHKHYIDFCAEHGIEYHSLDGFENIAWYGGTIVPYKGADITKSLPEIDLPEVIAYARQKGVRLRLWMHSAAAKAHMKTAFPVYEKWGIEGVMVDFFDRDDQETVNLIHELVRLAAKHHLTVTLHNVYKPTGLRRTYPNLLTTEAVYNLEFNKWDRRGSTPEHELIVPFVRMLAGPLDYHSGSFRNVTEQEFTPRNVAPITIGTRARQLARYVVYEGYLPMIADSPSAYQGQQGLDFLVQVPTSWDETKVLNGSVGKHITVARRRGTQWYIGSMTDSTARKLSIPLSFIGPGEFIAEVYADDPDAPHQPAKLIRRQFKVTSADTIDAVLAVAGGHVVRLTLDRKEPSR